MNCDEAGRLLNAHLDAELELPSSLAVDEHLASCARCRAAWPGAHRAAPGWAALALVSWLMLSRPGWPDPAPPPQAQRVVYHIASAEHVSASLRTLKNHLDAEPGSKVVVVAHNNGVEFLLHGARDESGRAYEEVVHDLRERGVEFRVCTNTLTRRRIEPQAVITEAALVPSGIAEISHLQGKEGYVYLRL